MSFRPAGAVGTYLITHSVATDPEAVRVPASFRPDEGCEIGAHLHAWDNPPFLADGRDRDHPALAHELPTDHTGPQACRVDRADFRHIPQLGRRMLRRLGVSRVVTASPIQFSGEDLLAMADAVTETGRNVLNLTMHSSEAAPGYSPRIRSQADLEELVGKIDAVMTRLRRNVPVEAVLLRDLVRSWQVRGRSWPPSFSAGGEALTAPRG